MAGNIGRFFINIARLIGVVLTGQSTENSSEYVSAKISPDGSLKVSDQSTSFTYTSNLVWDSFTYDYPSDTQEVITYYLNGTAKRIVTLNWTDATKVRFASGNYVDL